MTGSDEDLEVQRALRPAIRPSTVLVIAANLILAAIALGAPYARGRASGVVEGFSELAACLYGGRALEEPGLALPPGDREHFSAMALRGDPAWPARCLPVLAAMRPEPTLILFPGPKQAEENLRAALDLTAAQLRALADSRARGPLGVVPENPTRALDLVRSALVELLEANGLPFDPDAPSCALESTGAIEASRVPLQTVRGGMLSARLEDGGLRVISQDGRSVSEVVVHEGTVHLGQVRRPGSMRGVVMGPSGGMLLWIASDAACARSERGCSRRLMGIARFEDVPVPSPRHWLAAHPWGRVDRSVRVDRVGEVEVARVIADRGGGELEVRVFSLSPDAPTPTEAEPAAVAPREVVALGQVIDAALFEGGALWLARAGDTWSVRERTDDRVRELEVATALDGAVLGSGTVRLLGCAAWRVIAVADRAVIVGPGIA